MTWIASGPAITAAGRNLASADALAVALKIDDARLELLGSIGIFDPRLRARVERALVRWTGGSNDRTPPLVQQDGRDGLLRIELDDQVAYAEPAFAAVIYPEGVEQVELLFYDDGTSAVLPDTDGGSLHMRLSDTDAPSYIVIDAFVGNSTVRQVALARVVDGIARVRLRLGGRAAVLIGATLRVLSNARAAGSRDITWQRRLETAERSHATTAQAHPRIEHASVLEELGVFIHGTFATTLPHLAEISPLTGIPLYRYEHDTMRPIAENAEALVDAIARTEAHRVTLIGHSRGGLVATLAAAHICKTDNSALVDAYTYGTPHAGTPLASAMDGLLAYATLAAATQAGSLITGALTAALFGSSLPTNRLPDGWADMQPHSSFIRTLGLINTITLTAYGGDFDPVKPDLGLRPVFASQAMTELLAGANDLVVPVSSSCRPNPGCNVITQTHHFEYFEQSEVHAQIKQALGTILTP